MPLRNCIKEWANELKLKSNSIHICSYAFELSSEYGAGDETHRLRRIKYFIGF